MLAKRLLGSVLVLASLPVVSASAQVWIESGDAPSFPDSKAQVTRGEALDTLSGSTGSGDLRDAYCIRIVDPTSFLATTDPSTWPTANADFDTRLFLFRTDGAPVLANDDTFPQTPPYLSTLTGTATDGSGFVLTRPGEYVLVVGGSPEDPQDTVDANLFDIDSALDGIHGPDPAAGRFDRWEGGTPTTGSYDVHLAGVEPCQNNLDAVFANFGFQQNNRVCRGDGLGGFYCTDANADASETREVALGFVNGDPYLDAIFAYYDESSPQRNQVCLGDGQGGLACSDMSDDEIYTEGLALGFVDGDQNLDAVFAHRTSWDQVCLGDGLGGFSCGDVGVDSSAAFGVALGFVDSDNNLDAVFANDNSNRICLGDGLGGFACNPINADDNWSLDVALGFVNDDPHLDAVFANAGYPYQQKNRLCLGDGQGGFSCQDVSTDTQNTDSVALGLIDDDQNLDAIFTSGSGFRDRVCLGDGLGGFDCSDVSSDERSTVDVALGFVNGDQHLDAVFAAILNEPNHLCLGDGAGGFACTDLGRDSHYTIALAMGELDYRPATLPLFCFSFDWLCDGIEILSVLPDKTVVASWYNRDCTGAKSPMLGGYSGKNVSPRLSWLAADPAADLASWSFNLNVDARTFDLWMHGTDFSLTQIEDDQPYSVSPGACAFGPDRLGMPSSTGAER